MTIWFATRSAAPRRCGSIAPACWSIATSPPTASTNIPRARARTALRAEPPTLRCRRSRSRSRRQALRRRRGAVLLGGTGGALLNWRAFIEPESGAVLYLRALTDGVTGLVFNVDPMTKTNNPANLPSATSAILDVVRDNVALVDLGVPSGMPLTQSLIGSFVQLADKTAPSPTIPTTTSPFNFAFVSRTDDFAAVNAYYHCDRFFRIVRDTGFNIAELLRSHGVSGPGRSPRHGERRSMPSARAMPWATASASCSSRSPTSAAVRSASPATGGSCCTSSVATASCGITSTHPISVLPTAPATASPSFSTIPTR